MKTLLSQCLILTGCAVAPHQEPRVETMYVNVEVPVSCITQTPMKPELVGDSELKSLPNDKFVLALWLDRLLRRDYESKIEAVLEACKGTK